MKMHFAKMVMKHRRLYSEKKISWSENIQYMAIFYREIQRSDLYGLMILFYKGLERFDIKSK